MARCWNPPNHPARTRTWPPTYPNGPSLAHHWPNIAANGPNTALHRSPYELLEPRHAPHSPTWSNVDLGPTLARHSFQMAPKKPFNQKVLAEGFAESPILPFGHIFRDGFWFMFWLIFWHMFWGDGGWRVAQWEVARGYIYKDKNVSNDRSPNGTLGGLPQTRRKTQRKPPFPPLCGWPVLYDVALYDMFNFWRVHARTCRYVCLHVCLSVYPLACLDVCMYVSACLPFSRVKVRRNKSCIPAVFRVASMAHITSLHAGFVAPNIHTSRQASG